MLGWLLCAALYFVFLTAGPIVALVAAIVCLAALAASLGFRLLAAALARLVLSTLPASAATGDSILNALAPHVPEILNSKGATDTVANFKLDKDELARMAEAKLH